MALSRYIRDGKVPAPKIIETGKARLHVWSDEDVEHVRKLLPRIANGRKTRYKKHSAVSHQQSAKTKKKRTRKNK